MYAGKKAPKGQRKKVTTAVIADADYLLQKGRVAEEKERVEEQRIKEIAARKAARTQSASGGSQVGASGGSRASASGSGRVGKSTGGTEGQCSELEPANTGK